MSALRRALTVSAESVLPATLAGFGASFFAGALGLTALAIVRFTLTQTYDLPSINPLVKLVATTVGMAVALRAGGPRAAALFFGWTVVGLLLPLPGLTTFCSRITPDGTAPECTVSGFLLSAWPRWAGLAIGVAVAPQLLRTSRGENVTLHAAGFIALGTSVTSVALAIAQPSGALEYALVVELLVIALALAFAFIAGWAVGRSPDRRRALIVLCVALLLPAMLVQLPLTLASAYTAGPGALLPWLAVATPLLQCAVLVVSGTLANVRRTTLALE